MHAPVHGGGETFRKDMITYDYIRGSLWVGGIRDIREHQLGWPNRATRQDEEELVRTILGLRVGGVGVGGAEVYLS